MKIVKHSESTQMETDEENDIVAGGNGVATLSISVILNISLSNKVRKSFEFEISTSKFTDMSSHVRTCTKTTFWYFPVRLAQKVHFIIFLK